jgi:hypothetical protein
VYAGDDPINFNDRHGRMMDLVDDGGGGGFLDWGFGADIGGLDGGGDFTGIGDQAGGGGSQVQAGTPPPVPVSLALAKR